MPYSREKVCVKSSLLARGAETRDKCITTQQYLSSLVIHCTSCDVQCIANHTYLVIS